MWIRKYDFNYSRRHFMAQTARGVLATGVLMPLWDAIAADGTHERAYPEELLSIEAYTKGAIKPGDSIDAGNVELVRDLLDPIRYQQISQMGRRLDVVPVTSDIYKLSPPEYIDATLSNRGKARFDATGNVVVEGGKPWIGGNPFPDPANGMELFAGLTMTWGRHDVSFYCIKEEDLSAEGEPLYNYELCWAEFAPVGRLSIEPRPYMPGHEDKLRYQSLFFMAPNDAKGTSFLNIWHYDQTQFPDLYGYIPAFKRVRRFPANQRFEPVIAGSTLYLSDAWAAGDPLLTWGNYRIIGRGPYLAALSNNWNGSDPNWEQGTHGGAAGNSFWNTRVELVPEVIVVEAEPTGFKRAPISKKRVWFDARTGLPVGMVSFDRRGEPFKSFDGAYSVYDDGTNRVMDGKHPYWSWCQLHAHDIQTNRISRLSQVKTIAGGYTMRVNDPSVYDEFCTMAAIRRLGT